MDLSSVSGTQPLRAPYLSGSHRVQCLLSWCTLSPSISATELFSSYDTYHISGGGAVHLNDSRRCGLCHLEDTHRSATWPQRRMSRTIAHITHSIQLEAGRKKGIVMIGTGSMSLRTLARLPSCRIVHSSHKRSILLPIFFIPPWLVSLSCSCPSASL